MNSCIPNSNQIVILWLYFYSLHDYSRWVVIDWFCIVLIYMPYSCSESYWKTKIPFLSMNTWMKKEWASVWTIQLFFSMSTKSAHQKRLTNSVAYNFCRKYESEEKVIKMLDLDWAQWTRGAKKILRKPHIYQTAWQGLL